MRIIRPFDVTEAILLSSNVPEDDHPGWATGTHEQGYKCIVEHTIYEVVAETTTDEPTEGVAKEVPSWVVVGMTNRWRMFDDKVSSLTTHEGAISVVLKPEKVINSLALFNLVGKSVEVTVEDPLEGVVYQKTLSLVDARVSNWYDWFFAEADRRTDVVLLDLPAYSKASITVTIENGTADASCGHFVMGQQKELAVSLYGSSGGITDYTRKVTNPYGDTSVVVRPFSKRASLSVEVDSYRTGMFQRTLAEYRGKLLVWIGHQDFEVTIIYGFYKDFTVSISGPEISEGSVTIEGLI